MKGVEILKDEVAETIVGARGEGESPRGNNTQELCRPKQYSKVTTKRQSSTST
jgi:hypothetical protein